MIPQRGAALTVALIALVGMLVAAVALLRDDGRAASEQRQTHWQRSAMQAVDAALNEASLAYLQVATTPALNIVDRNRTDASIRYFATEQALDSDGVPRMLAAARAPTWSADGPSRTGWPGETIDANAQLLRRYVIERLCSQAGTASADHCQVYTTRFDADCRAVDGGGCQPTDSETLPYVRISVRIDAPHQTVVYGQLLMKGE